MDITPAQRRKMLAAADLIEHGDLAVLKKIVEFEDFIEERKKEFDQALASLQDTKGELANFKIQLSTELQNKIAEIEKQEGKPGEDGQTPTNEELLALIKPLIPFVRNGKDADEKTIIQEVLARIPEPIPGKDADEKEITAKIEGDLPKLGTVIRDGLELIQDEDEKLKIEAIGHLPEKLEALDKKISIRPTMVGGKPLLQLYVGSVKRGAVQYLNLIAGTNMTITYAASNGRNDVTFSASGGGSGSLSVISATGTINDTNKTFTLATQPTLVVVNGVAYNGTTGSITWTWVTTTLTLSQAVGSGGDLYGLA